MMEGGDCYGDGIIYDRQDDVNKFFASGVVGTVVIGVIFFITLYRTFVHAFKRSRKSRIAFHIILLLQLAFDWMYFMNFAMIPYYFCFSLYNLKYFWALRLFAKSLHYLSLVWISKTWFDLRNGILRRRLPEIFDQERIVKARSKWRSSFNECRVLILAFVIQLVIDTVVSARAIIIIKTPDDIGAVATDNLTQVCIFSTAMFSLVLALSLLYSGNSLRKTLRSNKSLDIDQCKRIIVKVNIALGLIVGCTLVSALVYVSWFISSRNNNSFWNTDERYFLYYFLNTILPVSIMNLSLLYLSRRTLPEKSSSKELEHQCTIQENEYYNDNSNYVKL